MRLPGKAYEVDWDKEYSEISFLRRKYDNPDASLKHIKLPRWLSDFIRVAIENSYNAGRKDFKIEIQRVLGIKE